MEVINQCPQCLKSPVLRSSAGIGVPYYQYWCKSCRLNEDGPMSDRLDKALSMWNKLTALSSSSLAAKSNVEEKYKQQIRILNSKITSLVAEQERLLIDVKDTSNDNYRLERKCSRLSYAHIKRREQSKQFYSELNTVNNKIDKLKCCGNCKFFSIPYTAPICAFFGTILSMKRCESWTPRIEDK